MKPVVVIDSFPDSAKHYRDDYAIVVIDVIRATTTATTALSLGRRVFPVKSTDKAYVIAETLENPLLLGELGGNVPYGFDLTNSPVQVAALSAIPSGSFTDISRPLISLSSSGTQLLINAIGSEAVYIACFRNFSAVAEFISGRHEKVAVLGAGTRGRFRREDQICCAWITEKLIEAGYRAENSETQDIVSLWSGVNPEIVKEGQSADYLKRSGQVHDLEFVVHHIDDLDIVPQLVNEELVVVSGNLTHPSQLLD